MVQLAAIINSFNRLELLKRGLPSLCAALQECGQPSAVVVYDAGSTDGTKEWLTEFRAANPQAAIEWIFPARNEDTSFSAGINSACARALEQFPDLRWLFLFETDNWIADATPLQQALRLLKMRPELGAVGFTVTSHSGSPCGYACAFPTVSGFILGPQLAERWHWDARRRGEPIVGWRRDGELEWSYADVVFTSPILITRQAWVQSGGLDQSRFPYSECDIDWAWRLRKLGVRQGVLQVTGVVHDNMQSLSQWSATRVIRFHQARLQLLRLHRGESVNWIKPLLLLRHCAEWIGLLLLGIRRPNWRASLAKRGQLIRTVLAGYR